MKEVIDCIKGHPFMEADGKLMKGADAIHFETLEALE
jgi:hypothetical protein